MCATARSLQHDLPALVSVLQQQQGFDEVVQALRSGNSGTIDGAWGSACALTLATLAKQATGTLLVVAPTIHQVDELAVDLAAFTGSAPLIFPAWEMWPPGEPASDPVFGSRLRVLSDLRNQPSILLTSFPAVMQPIPSQNQRSQSTRRLAVGEELDLDAFLEWLVAAGFERTSAIESPGEFSKHGGIIDLFPPAAIDPVRIELFGDEIDSIRKFDAETQRKIDSLQQIELTLIQSMEADGAEESLWGESLCDVLPADSWVALVAMHEMIDEAKHYLARLDSPRGIYGVEATLAKAMRRPNIVVEALASDSTETACHLRIESVERLSGPKSEVLDELAGLVSREETVLIACHNEGERERLAEMLQESHPELNKRVQLCLGRVEHGFRIISEKQIIISDHELFGRVEVRRQAPKKQIAARAIDSFLELSEGDLVVHLTNGIGRYRGMQLLEKEEQVEEHLILEFRDKVLVYVPVSLIHLVQKYVGAAKGAPNLSKLGTRTWSRKKQKVAAEVIDMASDMLKLQAAREAKAGIRFPPDSHWQQEFDAAFPYTPTDDQIKAVAELKADMQMAQPMDRLICGDVGYGKTEVAMRAAFKAIDGGKQVAVLVPTTVLAEQHYRTFSDRMAEFPITIDVISRFRTKGEQRQIIQNMQEGKVDLVIGTHRLVQRDVVFRDLGLVIIDEEQRFGVEAKEMLKQLRLEVDVLTLSATPIPRTLHMSLLGIRDISNLETAPQDRQAVETRITRFDKELIRHAIVRELNRGGQVYFVHNRVHSIQGITETLRQIVPEATFDIGHGQMSGDQLEQAMVNFVAGKTDVLVCTTIIESGLDIPNANTIFIHQADTYGLADLHQLRGRVGRYHHRAYCYLMLEEGKPLTTIASKRLKAVEEFSELGAGFKIAMRDLEIRGAGNILGTQQSGHIATVGYELYCQLLENAVRTLKKQPLREHRHVAVDLPIAAYLPSSYVPPGRHKVEMYRKVYQASDLQALTELKQEMRDRFGPIPDASSRLFEVKELQLLAQNWQIDDIHLEGKFAVFGYRNPMRIRELAARLGSRLRVVDQRFAYLLREHTADEPTLLFAELKSVLQLT